MYQIENVNWCRNVENLINEEENINIIGGYDNKIKIDNYHILNTNILYMNGKVLVSPESFKIPKYSFHSQGGLLCDNTGLGKTLTLTVHIMEDKTKTIDICNKRATMLLAYKNIACKIDTEMGGGTSKPLNQTKVNVPKPPKQPNAAKAANAEAEEKKTEPTVPNTKPATVPNTKPATVPNTTPATEPVKGGRRKRNKRKSKRKSKRKPRS